MTGATKAIGSAAEGRVQTVSAIASVDFSHGVVELSWCHGAGRHK